MIGQVTMQAVSMSFVDNYCPIRLDKAIRRNFHEYFRSTKQRSLNASSMCLYCNTYAQRAARQIKWETKQDKMQILWIKVVPTKKEGDRSTQYRQRLLPPIQHHYQPTPFHPCMNVSAFISYRDNNASINKGQSSPKMPNQSAGEKLGNLRCKRFCKSLLIELNGGRGGLGELEFLFYGSTTTYRTGHGTLMRKCNLTAFVSLL